MRNKIRPISTISSIQKFSDIEIGESLQQIQNDVQPNEDTN